MACSKAHIVCIYHIREEVMHRQTEVTALLCSSLVSFFLLLRSVEVINNKELREVEREK